MEHNGDVYSCDHFVYPEYHLGNILSTPLAQMVGSNRQVAFGNSKRGTLPQYCIHCDYRFACNGECPKHRFMLTPDGEPGLSYLCNAYKEFFAHVHPYMQIMADELMAQRPPANVMEWARNN
jgi:radical SAM additional 4Fe4S-binding domain